MIAERYIIRKQQSLSNKNMSIGPATCWHQHTLAHPMCLLGCSAGSRTGSSANVQSSFSNPGPLHQAPCVACESAPSPSENAPESLITSTPWDRYVLTCLRSYYWEQFETIYGFTVYQRCFRMSSVSSVSPGGWCVAWKHAPQHDESRVPRSPWSPGRRVSAQQRHCSASTWQATPTKPPKVRGNVRMECRMQNASYEN